MNSFGVPVGISEDWDRPDRMRDGSLVAGIGTEVLANTDVAQLHVMAYCETFLDPTSFCKVLIALRVSRSSRRSTYYR